jgi:hypothetical protein
VPEHLANALAASECLRHVAPLKLACPPLLVLYGLAPRGGPSAGLLEASSTPFSLNPPPASLKGSSSKAFGGKGFWRPVDDAHSPLTS